LDPAQEHRQRPGLRAHGTVAPVIRRASELQSGQVSQSQATAPDSATNSRRHNVVT
jgi:hypothetical protein